MLRKFRSLFSGMLLAAAMALLIFSPCVHAQPLERAMPITFGADASPDQGDNDNRQEILLRVATDEGRTLYLRIFDPDVGGAVDEIMGEWNTATRFSLYGGEIDIRAEYADGDNATEAEITGELLHQQDFAEDRLLDGQWFNLAEFQASQGLEKDGDRLFKLVVDGLSGDDGNIFDLAVSVDSQRNIAPEGLEIFSYLPTVHVPKGSGRFGEARFFVPAGVAEIAVHNFDLDRASVWLETPFRRLDTVNASASGAWVVDKVTLDPWEQGMESAISLAAFPNTVNDATFYVTSADGTPLAFNFPFRLFPTNHRPEPAVTTTVLNDCREVVFDASASRDADFDQLFFEWRIGDQTLSGNPVSHSFEESGGHRVRLTVRDGSGTVGSRARQEVEVFLNRPPSAVIEAPERAMPGEEVRFDATGSRDEDGEIKDYFWDFGDGEKATGVAVSHRYARPGYYRVTLRVVDDSASPCATSVEQRQIWVNAPPIVIAPADKRGAVDVPVSFEPQRVYDSDSQVEKFHWDFGDGNRAEGRSVAHRFAAPGEYLVTLGVDDGSGVGNSRAEDSLRVIINDPPLPDANADKRIAANQTVLFDGGGSTDPDGEIIAYRWEFGDNASASGAQVKHAYAEPGVYTARLTVTDDSGTASAVQYDEAQVIVNFPPLAVAGEDQHLQRSVVAFDAGASSDEDGEIIAYRWRFGDGHEGEGVAPSHVYANPGEYPVDLAVEDDSATLSRFDADRLVVRVNAGPIADPGPPVSVEPGQVVIFDGSGSADGDGVVQRYHWRFGDGSEAHWQRIGHAFKAPGVYPVRLRVGDDSGLAEAYDEGEVTVVVNQPPRAVVHAPERVAPGDPVWFDGGGSRDPDGEIVDWRWRFSDNETRAGEARVERRFDAPGVYYADLTVDDGKGLANSVAHARGVVQVNHQPLAIPGADVESCDTTLLFDASASVDGDGDGLSYHWDFGDGASASGARVSHSYQQGGVYPVVLSVDDGQGLSNSRHSGSLTATINQRPLADAGEDRTVCAGDSIVFSGANSIDPKGRFLKYHWWFGDGGEGYGVNPVRIFREAGVYPVRLLVEDDSGLACGRDTDSMVLRVAESPIADAGEDIETCANTEITFDGGGSRDADGLVNRFAWDFGDGAEGGGPSPSHMYLEPGEYQVRLTITGDRIGSCDNRDTDRIKVKVHAAPKAVIHAPSQAAVEQVVTFDASASEGGGADIVSWEWDFGDGERASGERVEHAYAQPGRYYISLKVTTDSGSQCDQVTQSSVITVNAPPVARGKVPEAGAIHQPLRFDSGESSDPDGAVANHIWDFGDGERLEGVQVAHAYRAAGEYEVRLRVEDDSGQSNGSDEQRFTIRINAPPQARIAAPAVACRGEEVAFDASASKDPDGVIEGFDWVFGDGLTGEGERIRHRYRRAGRYQIGLRVEDDSGVANRRGFASHPLRINRPPRVNLLAPAQACAGEALAFDGGGSLDPDGDAIALSWAFGDNATAAGEMVEHVYSEPGSYSVTLRAEDDSGSACAVAETTTEVRVNHPPQAVAGEDRETWIGGAHDLVMFDASASQDVDGERLGYHWDFGDGATQRGERVRHRYVSPGSYQVVLTVDDGSGLSCGVARDTVTVEARLRE